MNTEDAFTEVFKNSPILIVYLKNGTKLVSAVSVPSLTFFEKIFFSKRKKGRLLLYPYQLIEMINGQNSATYILSEYLPSKFTPLNVIKIYSDDILFVAEASENLVGYYFHLINLIDKNNQKKHPIDVSKQQFSKPSYDEDEDEDGMPSKETLDALKKDYENRKDMISNIRNLNPSKEEIMTKIFDEIRKELDKPEIEKNDEKPKDKKPTLH